MRVGAAGDEVEALRLQPRERRGIGDHRAGVVWNSGRSASPKATALAAMTCISGPPCRPGKTALLIFFATASSFVRIMPPRGPRSVLYVVVVTTCA